MNARSLAWVAMMVALVAGAACTNGSDSSESASDEVAVIDSSPAAEARESFEGYNPYPSDPSEFQSVIDARDLHGATQAYLWSVSMATVLAWEEANLKVADYFRSRMSPGSGSISVPSMAAVLLPGLTRART